MERSDTPTRCLRAAWGGRGPTAAGGCSARTRGLRSRRALRSPWRGGLGGPPLSARGLAWPLPPTGPNPELI